MCRKNLRLHSKNKMKNPWTKDQEVKLAKLKSEGKSLTEIATAVGRTIRGVEHKLVRMNGPKEAIPLTYEQDRAERGGDYWEHQYSILAKKYDRALKEQSVVDQLVADIQSCAPKSYTAFPPYPRDPLRLAGKGTPETAVLLFSDTHVGQVVRPDQTLGFGGYNFDIFLDRLRRLERSVLSIVEDHTTTAIPKLVVAMLGDMLHGALNHSAEAGQVNTLFSQWFGASHAIAQFLRNVAAHFPEVEVKTVVGNHTRWGTQHKMPTDNRFSNLDQFLYAMIAALTKDIKTIKWDLNQQPFSVFKIGDYVFHAAHGDTLRGGDKALGIPNHSVGRAISVTTQLYNKHGVTAPHYYLTGHLHRSITLPHATGEFLVNGGFPGLDGYALANNFNPIDPTQRFFLVHPKYGKTASYEIGLKFSINGSGKSHYTIPSGFELV